MDDLSLSLRSGAEKKGKSAEGITNAGDIQGLSYLSKAQTLL
jgi:hypothetical protein